MAVVIKSDIDIQRDVLAELAWDPEIDLTDVGVEVDDGIVTLTGTVDNYWTRWAAEQAALRVDGVRAVVNDISVKALGQRTDTDVAQDIVDALALNIMVPPGRVKVAVEDGWVTLTGEVDWQFQRVEAESVVRSISGVTGVTNLIRVKRRTASPADIKKEIENALIRTAQVDAKQIQVHVEDGHVTLSGTVRSWAERAEAEKAAWRAPGVTKVTNEIRVQPVIP
jgi:osmotically-inducible protein OsmY